MMLTLRRAPKVAASVIGGPDDYDVLSATARWGASSGTRGARFWGLDFMRTGRNSYVTAPLRY
jgi:hypothetical protein